LVRKLLRTLGVVLALVGAPCAPADDFIAPNANLQAVGIPPIPAALAAKLEPYTQFKPATAVSWHPVARELVVAKRTGNTTQLHRVDRPLGALAPITDFAEPVRFGLWWPRAPDVFVFTRDAGGNEQRQVYRLDPGSREPVLLTDPSQKHDFVALTHARDRALIASTALDKTGRNEHPTTTLTLLDPLHPETARTIATLDGTGWGDYTFSFDDRRLGVVQSKSVNESYVYVIDVATGSKRRVFPREGAKLPRPVSTSELAFDRAGTGLFLTTDRDGEFHRLARLDIATGRVGYFGARGAFDTDVLRLSPDGRTLAVITNEAGVGVLRLYEAATRKPLARPTLPVGDVERLVWHENSRDLAFSIDSAQSPSDAYSLDVTTNALTRWTETNVPGLDANAFRSAEPMAWSSFDGRRITGFIIRPPPKFTGKRPVIVTIHGGPESQARPGFIARWNYFVDELGIAIVFPNVRGSTGFGKTFVALDNGMRREDSVRDIGALLDWVGRQPDLDASRVLIEGGSYGGYMALAVATHFGKRIAGTIDVVGIANFVSFLENTESYRRDLRRVEYGDEREPRMRAFLARISPVANADRISAPLFVVHGKNDPRVPYTEAEQIVAAAQKNGVPVWYLLADNEGHGYVRKANADYLFYAMVKFVQAYVLR
jgi:dipeptidyl aminopeptidase/acylaminoacyl peptidase